MHTHTQAQLHFLFLCLGAAPPLQHCTARDKCQETEATLKRSAAIRIAVGRGMGMQKASTCMSQSWLDGWYPERNTMEK